MCVIQQERVRILHILPGRLRIHWPSWSGHGREALEQRLCQLRGVRSARANPWTKNVLIHFEPTAADPSTLLAAVHAGAVEAPRGEHRLASLALARLFLKVLEILANLLTGKKTQLLLSCFEAIFLITQCATRC
jgi:hypothetical protein